MENADLINSIDADAPPEIDWAVGRELVGTSDRQTAFARAIVEGLNQSRAAEAAGYKGTSDQMRSIGWRVANSQKVRALIAWARAGGAGPDDTEGDLDELRRILWRHARGADKNHSIKAAETLHRLKMQEKDAERRASDDPEETIRSLIRVAGEFGALTALGLQLKLHGTVYGLPMVEKLLPFIAHRWPGTWADMRRVIGGGDSAHHLEHLDRLASGPVPAELDSILPKPKPNGATRPGNGHAKQQEIAT